MEGRLISKDPIGVSEALGATLHRAHDAQPELPRKTILCYNDPVLKSIRSDMKKELSKEQLEELRRLAEMPDEEIDLSDPDNPPVRDWSGGLRGKFYCPGTGND